MAQNKSLSTQEVAEILHVSKSTIYDLIRKGEIHSYKIGRKVRFTQDDVDTYIAHGKRQDLKDQTWLMNATHILLGNAGGTVKSDFSKFWRTRNGTADEHTSFTIAYNLAMAAKMAGAEVDYSLVWAAPHGDVDGDGTGSFVAWVHEIVK